MDQLLLKPFLPGLRGNMRAVLQLLEMSAFTDARSSVHSTQRDVEKTLERVRTCKHIPQDIAQGFESAAQRLLDFNADAALRTAHRTRPASGPIMGWAEVKRAIVSGSGLRGWTRGPLMYDETEDDGPGERVKAVMQALSDEYGIAVSSDQIKCSHFSRDYDSRSELNFADIAVFPGGVYIIDGGTDRTSGFDALCKSYVELEKFFANF